MNKITLINDKKNNGIVLLELVVEEKIKKTI